MTKRTTISLPSDLYVRIERARKRAGMDRSTWLQEAAGEYLSRRTQNEEIEAYFAGYERSPLTADEISLLRWNERGPSEPAAPLRRAAKGGRRGAPDRAR